MKKKKRQLFQVDGDCQVKALEELYMTARCTHNPEQRNMARGLMAKLRFYKACNMEFEDKRTVYSECAFRLSHGRTNPACA